MNISLILQVVVVEVRTRSWSGRGENPCERKKIEDAKWRNRKKPTWNSPSLSRAPRPKAASERTHYSARGGANSFPRQLAYTLAYLLASDPPSL